MGSISPQTKLIAKGQNLSNGITANIVNNIAQHRKKQSYPDSFATKAASKGNIIMLRDYSALSAASPMNKIKGKIFNSSSLTSSPVTLIKLQPKKTLHQSNVSTQSYLQISGFPEINLKSTGQNDKKYKNIKSFKISHTKSKSSQPLFVNTNNLEGTQDMTQIKENQQISGNNKSIIYFTQEKEHKTNSQIFHQSVVGNSQHDLKDSQKLDSLIKNSLMMASAEKSLNTSPQNNGNNQKRLLEKLLKNQSLKSSFQKEEEKSQISMTDSTSIQNPVYDQQMSIQSNLPRIVIPLAGADSINDERYSHFSKELNSESVKSQQNLKPPLWQNQSQVMSTGQNFTNDSILNPSFKNNAKSNDFLHLLEANNQNLASNIQQYQQYFSSTTQIQQAQQYQQNFMTQSLMNSQRSNTTPSKNQNHYIQQNLTNNAHQQQQANQMHNNHRQSPTPPPMSRIKISTSFDGNSQDKNHEILIKIPIKAQKNGMISDALRSQLEYIQQIINKEDSNNGSNNSSSGDQGYKQSQEQYVVGQFLKRNSIDKSSNGGVIIISSNNSNININNNNSQADQNYGTTSPHQNSNHKSQPISQSQNRTPSPLNLQISNRLTGESQNFTTSTNTNDTGNFQIINKNNTSDKLQSQKSDSQNQQSKSKLSNKSLSQTLQEKLNKQRQDTQKNKDSSNRSLPRSIAISSQNSQHSDSKLKTQSQHNSTPTSKSKKREKDQRKVRNIQKSKTQADKSQKFTDKEESKAQSQAQNLKNGGISQTSDFKLSLRDCESVINNQEPDHNIDSLPLEQDQAQILNTAPIVRIDGDLTTQQQQEQNSIFQQYNQNQPIIKKTSSKVQANNTSKAQSVSSRNNLNSLQVQGVSNAGSSLWQVTNESLVSSVELVGEQIYINDEKKQTEDIQNRIVDQVVQAQQISILEGQRIEQKSTKSQKMSNDCNQQELEYILTEQNASPDIYYQKHVENNDTTPTDLQIHSPLHIEENLSQRILLSSYRNVEEQNMLDVHQQVETSQMLLNPPLDDDYGDENLIIKDNIKPEHSHKTLNLQNLSKSSDQAQQSQKQSVYSRFTGQFYQSPLQIAKVQQNENQSNNSERRNKKVVTISKKRTLRSSHEGSEFRSQTMLVLELGNIEEKEEEHQADIDLNKIHSPSHQNVKLKPKPILKKLTMKIPQKSLGDAIYLQDSQNSVSQRNIYKKKITLKQNQIQLESKTPLIQNSIELFQQQLVFPSTTIPNLQQKIKNYNNSLGGQQDHFISPILKTHSNQGINYRLILNPVDNLLEQNETIEEANLFSKFNEKSGSLDLNLNYEDSGINNDQQRQVSIHNLDEQDQGQVPFQTSSDPLSKINNKNSRNRQIIKFANKSSIETVDNETFFGIEDQNSQQQIKDSPENPHHQLNRTASNGFNLLKLDLNNSVSSLMSGKPRKFLRFDSMKHIIVSRNGNDLMKKSEGIFSKNLQNGIKNLLEEYKSENLQKQIDELQEKKNSILKFNKAIDEDDEYLRQSIENQQLDEIGQSADYKKQKTKKLTKKPPIVGNNNTNKFKQDMKQRQQQQVQMRQEEKERLREEIARKRMQSYGSNILSENMSLRVSDSEILRLPGAHQQTSADISRVSSGFQLNIIQQNRYQ
eukprot:403369678